MSQTTITVLYSLQNNINKYQYLIIKKTESVVVLWDIQRQIMVWGWKLGQGSFKVTENGTVQCWKIGLLWPPRRSKNWSVLLQIKCESWTGEGHAGTSVSLHLAAVQQITDCCWRKLGSMPVTRKAFGLCLTCHFSPNCWRVVHARLQAFLESNLLMPKTQSMYRKYHTTETAVTRIYNDLLQAAGVSTLPTWFNSCLWNYRSWAAVAATWASIWSAWHTCDVVPFTSVQ